MERKVDYDYFTLERLAELPYRELRELFSNLDAPDPEEMDGEYISRYPVAFERERQLWIEENRGGHWFGKCYRPTPIGPCRGEGHNIYEKKGQIAGRYLRFGWDIGNSTIDGRPSLIMRYNIFERPTGAMSLTDEVRRVRRGLYMGFYYNYDRVNPPFNFGWDEKTGCTKPEFFFLLGPISKWQGPDEDSLKHEVIKQPVAQEVL